MIPILYGKSETAFTSNGLGRLTDCISCLVTEERNGIFECEFQYPVTGKLYNEMVTNGGIVSVTHDDAKDRQPFDIYKYSAPINGIVTFNARHISYRLSGIVVKPYTAASCALALNGIVTNSVSTNPFTFWTDKAVTTTFKLETPTSAKALLVGQQGSILDVYGKGEYKFDKFEVKLYTNRGTNSGVTIRYGKNLSDTLVENDSGEYYNAIVPYWKGQDGTLVTLTGWYVVQTGETLKYCIPVDFSSEFETQPTELELQTKAAAYLANNTPWLPKENVKVDFVQLWNTDEYKDVAVLERVKLCDTVAIYYPALGLTNSSAKVIKVVYDTLLERYSSIELGEPQQTLAQAIIQPYAEAIASISDKASVSFMEEAIQAATDLIAGGLGGHVVINRNADGEPEEILIMDTDNTSTAVNVWRWNLNGLAHSHSGYNGPFDDIAITQDGKINASMITTGVINANLIAAGTITADKLNANDINSSKTLTVGAMTDAAAATVLNSNIQIGGRNLATGTAETKTFTTQANQNFFSPAYYSLSTYGGTAISDTNNTQITASFDYAITGVDTQFDLTISLRTGSGTYAGGFFVAKNIPVGSSSGHAEGTRTISDAYREYAGGGGVLFSGKGNANANAVLTVSNLKVEIGNKATTWTQAPEDVSADIATAQSTAEGANSQEQLIYISKASGTTTQSATTTWITNTTGNQNTWTIKRPVYNSSYPVLFVATQRKSVGGTVTCTTPQIDQTTTVIDGGHITTGTIDAGVVNVTNINASNITSGTMSANKIQGGTLIVGGQNNENGAIIVKDASGNTTGTIDNTGANIYGSLSSNETVGGVSFATQINGANIRIINGSLPMFTVVPKGDGTANGRVSMGGSNATLYLTGSDLIYYARLNGNPFTAVTMGVAGTDPNSYGVLSLAGPSADGMRIQSISLNPSGVSRFGSSLGGGDVEINGVLDLTQRRAYSASLSAGTWYRVLVFDTSSLGGSAAAYARGATGHEVVLHITRSRTNAGEETHEIKMLCQYDNVSFVDEVSKTLSGYQRITKIRYTYDSTHGYVDIYALNDCAYVTVDFEVYCEPAYQALYTSGNLVAVSAGGTGTVLSTYTFAENVPDAGAGYIKNPDGTMIQWGQVSGISFSSQNMVNGTEILPQAFVDTNYAVSITPWYTGVNYLILRTAALAATTNTFNWVLGSGDSTNISATSRGFRYIAVGRWK